MSNAFDMSRKTANGSCLASRFFFNDNPLVQGQQILLSDFSESVLTIVE